MVKVLFTHINGQNIVPRVTKEEHEILWFAKVIIPINSSMQVRLGLSLTVALTAGARVQRR